MALVLGFTVLGGAGTIAPKKAEATCYPAIECYAPMPKYYTKIYENKDRRAGAYTGGIVVGGLGFFGGTAGSVLSFVAGAGIGLKETWYGYNSYRVYVKKSDKKEYSKKILTIYYKDVNFKGKTKERVKYVK